MEKVSQHFKSIKSFFIFKKNKKIVLQLHDMCVGNRRILSDKIKERYLMGKFDDLPKLDF